MDQLIIRMLQGRARPEEIAWVRRWRRRSRENEARFRELEEIWEFADEKGDTPFRRPVPDPDALIRRVEAGSSGFVAGQAGQEGSGETPDHEIQEVRDPAPLIYGSRVSNPDTASDAGSEASENEGIAEKVGRPKRWIPLAAVAAVLVTVAVGLLQLDSILTGSAPAITFTEITTGAGEMTTVQIPDGSTVRLGPQSRLRLSLDGERRVAWLEGRAFFGVSEDSSREFTVRTSMGETVVLGTRFEVRTEEEFQVLVVDGRVSVAAGGSQVELNEGEMSRTRPGAPPRTEQVQDIYLHLAWMGDVLVFQRTPLVKAMEEIERLYGLEMHLEDPSLADHRVTVTFTSDRIEEIVTVLCEIIGAQCTIEEENRVRIGTRGVSSAAQVR